MAVNSLGFMDFLDSLKQTNMTLGDLTNFHKCFLNASKISMKLNALNFLLGKENLKQAISDLFDENPKCFEVLNLLIAVRDNKKILNQNGDLTDIFVYFSDKEKIYEFFNQTGLESIFKDKKITNLNDYVFGIEVGLDSNARKNRSGDNMQNMVASIFVRNEIYFEEQVSITEFYNLNLGLDNKVFDFVIKSKDKIYLIETNFYSVGSSKLNEVARSYIEISDKVANFEGFYFIWITDGKGWLSSKNKLQEAYKSIEIYNLTNINYFIEKVKNG